MENIIHRVSTNSVGGLTACRINSIHTLRKSKRITNQYGCKLKFSDTNCPNFNTCNGISADTTTQTNGQTDVHIWLVHKELFL
jgi:hypothetical protein